MSHTAHNRHVQVGNIAKLDGVIRLGKNRFTQIFPDLGGIDINAERKLDVTNVIPAKIDMHQTRNTGVLRGVLVILHTLHER